MNSHLYTPRECECVFVCAFVAVVFCLLSLVDVNL